MALQAAEHLREENRVLKNELERLEELLVVSRAERDQIGIRYNAISERLEAVLKRERGDMSSDEVGRQSLVQQNIELRRKLEEEHSNYKQKLQFYQDGQARQAQLVQKLQAKVLQYKNRCAELEEQLRQAVVGTERGPRRTILSSTQENYETEKDEMQFGSLDQLDSKTLDLDSAVIQLEGEQNRVEHLSHVNGLLREQLDKATAANQSLMADLHRLAHIEEELRTKEAEWQKEEQSFHDYYAHTHSHLIDLWRTICAFRRDFNEMKLASEHELSHLASEFYNDTQEITSQLQNSKTHAQTSFDKERSDRLALEGQLAEKVRQLNETQSKYDAKLKDFTTRNNELSSQNESLRQQLTAQKNEEEVRRISRQQQPTAASAARADRWTERSSYASVFETLRHIAKDLLDNCDYVDSTIIQGENDNSKLRSSQSTYHQDRRGGGGGSTDLTSSSVHHMRSVSHSPLRARASRSPSPTNSEEMASLVRRALQRSRQQIIDLTSKLTSYQTENQSVRNECRDIDSERQRLEVLLRNGHEERDKLHLDSKRHLDQMKVLLDSVGAEKERLEENRQKLLEKIDVLSIEAQRLKAANAELQKNRDDLNIDKEELKRNVERQEKEIERFRHSVEQSEEKLCRLREELVLTKEALNASQLRKDMTEREKDELDGALSRAERRRDALEAELNQVKAEAGNLRETVNRIQITCDTLNHEKIELTHSHSQAESERKSLMSRISGLEEEVSGLRTELVSVEREKVDVENQKSAVVERLKLAEKAQKDLDEENHRTNADRNELVQKMNAESRQKKSLIEEMRVSRQEVERLLGICNRSNSEKEELIRERAELLTKNDSQEKVNQQLNEVVMGVKMEKGSLEAELYQLDQLNSQLEKRTAMLEVENKELLDRREQLQMALSKAKGELDIHLEKLESQRRLLHQQLLDKDRETEERLRQERLQNEERLRQLIKERDEKAVDHQKELDRLKEEFSVERKEMAGAYEEQINELNEEIENIQRDYDEQLIMIANDKQQTLSELEQERSLLHEKLLLIEKKLKDDQLTNENQKRDWQNHKEQLQGSVGSLQMETKNLRVQIDESRLRHETDLKKLNALISDLQNQLRDDELSLNEVSQLRRQLKLAEEATDDLKRELIEVNRKLREANEAYELSVSEISNLKRTIEQETFEKDAALKSSTDFRNMVKKSEGEKLELNRINQELKQKISVLEEQIVGAEKELEELRGRVRESEKAHIESRRAQQELNHQIQQLESERKRQTQEMNDMHGRLVRGQEKEDELRKENLSLKQQVLEADGSRDGILKELAIVNRKKTQLEEDFRLQESEFRRVLDESRSSERTVDEQRRRLEKTLEAANSNEAELRLRLSEADGKIRGLEEHLVWVEDGKHKAEEKLNSIVSCLQRTIGFSATGGSRSRSTIRMLRGRSPSHVDTTGASFSSESRIGRRSLSPVFRSRSVSPSPLTKASSADVSVGAIRSALRDFVERLTQTERDKDQSANSLRSLVNKLQEMEEEYRRSSQKVQLLQRTLNEMEEIRRDFESRLVTERKSLTAAHEEAVRHHNNEQKQMEEEANQLKRSLAAAEQNKHLIEQELNEKLKTVETRTESEKRALRQSLEEVEGRLTKGELVRATLEGEVQRLKRILCEREAEVGSMCSQAENQSRVIRDLEQKLQSVEATNDDLEKVVAQTQTDLELHRNELHSLKSLMQERLSAIVSLQEQEQHLQRTLDASEQDRRVLQERLEGNRHSLNEVKKQNNSYIERIHDLEKMLSQSEHEKTEAEGNNKLSLLAVKKKEELEEEFLEKIQKLQAEKFHLQELIGVHQRNEANIEMEKQSAERSAGALEKENAVLIMTLEKADHTEKTKGKLQLCDECLNLDRRLRMMDEDNAELRRQLQTLQAQFDQAEHDYEQKLTDLKVLHNREKESAIDHLRSHWQKNLDDQNRNNRQRIRSLEQQIETLRRELELEIRKRQQYISHGLGSDDERKRLLAERNTPRPFSTDLDPLLFADELKLTDDSRDSRRSTTPHRPSSLPMATAAQLSPLKSTEAATRRSTTSILQRVSIPVPVLLRRK